MWLIYFDEFKIFNKDENSIYCRGFSRFVNIRDGRGATPLHLAARQRRSECVHTLLCSGALVCASTSRYG
jgi:ankyrin repeat protein